MTSYSRDNDVVEEVTEVIRNVAERFHEPLVKAGVTFEVLAAYAGENQQHALLLHGWPCLAVVKINSYKDRVRGLSDVMITVDGHRWSTLNIHERVALIDHELQHLQLKLGADVMSKQPDGTYILKPGAVTRDDADRPKLKMRPHDWEIGGFDLIVARHGRASAELQACQQMLAPGGELRKQLYLFDYHESPDEEVHASAFDPSAGGIDLSSSDQGDEPAPAHAATIRRLAIQRRKAAAKS